MGMFSGIFGQPPAATPAAAGPAAPSGTPAPAGTPAPSGTPAGAAPATPAPTLTPEQQALKGLDDFTKLWQTPTDKEGKPVAPTADPLSLPVLNFDPKQVAETVKSADFTKGVNPELATKALGGDVASLMQLLNQVTQTAVAGVTLQQGQFINQALAQQAQRLNAALPQHIKKVQLQEVPADNPLLSHPSVAPLANALKQMAYASNPQASASEIDRLVQGYLNQFADTASALKTQKQEAQNPTKATAPADTDWSEF